MISFFFWQISAEAFRLHLMHPSSQISDKNFQNKRVREVSAPTNYHIYKVRPNVTLHPTQTLRLKIRDQHSAPSSSTFPPPKLIFSSWKDKTTLRFLLQIDHVSLPHHHSPRHSLHPRHRHRHPCPPRAPRQSY